MSEWQETTLGDMITLQRGHDLAKTEMQFGSIPVAGSNGIIGYHDKATTKALGITIGRSGNIGNPHLYKEDFWAHNTTLYVKNFKGNDEIYVYYLLKSIDFTGFNVGSAVPTLNRNHIHPMVIQKPSREEQKAIASVLSSLDDKIDLLHRQNTTLERMAETLFRQWFIEEAQEDWETGVLGDVVAISYGKNLPTNQLLETGYPVFGGNGQIGFFNKYLYEKPQVLVSCRGEASGKVNISLPYSFVTNNSLALVNNKREELTFEFIKYFSLNYDFTLHVSGSAQPQITIDGLYGADFTIPPKQLIDKFTLIVSDLETKKLNNYYQIQTLEKLRDNLLPKLMSGDVRVL